MASNTGRSGGKGRGNSGGSRKGSSAGRDGGAGAAEVARAARRQLAELTGRAPESVLGLSREDGGWKVTVELVELSRIPTSTDLLGCYVVALDDDGELIGYERVRRYQRGQAGGDEG